VTKFLLFAIFHYAINKIFILKNFLLDQQNASTHKKKVLSSLKTPLSGGFFFIASIIFLNLNLNNIFLYSLFILYLIGIASDVNYISSARIRLLLQTACIFFCIILNDISIKNLSIELLNQFLDIEIFNMVFLTICLLVLINGFNFLDGINTLVIGNFIISMLAIYYVSYNNKLILDFIVIKNLLTIFSVIYTFNFFGKSFLGDSGTYSMSFLIGILYVNFAYDNYLVISPYFIACLLWYPAIENLFTIIRRSLLGKKISKPDNLHLHHLLFNIIKKNTSLKNNLFINTATGVFINIYITISAMVGAFYFNHTKSLLIIIAINSFTYLITYFILYKKNNLR
jgi:UDP-N-acetylmuramyl pentapeptide phosphotransferase/UDP-N-acetylglucosamine-1-phosphate transferase